MQIKTLYIYKTKHRGTVVSLEKPNCAYTERVRLIADEGKALTKDGVTLYPCIDVDSVSGWFEVSVPSEKYV